MSALLATFAPGDRVLVLPTDKTRPSVRGGNVEHVLGARLYIRFDTGELIGVHRRFVSKVKP